MVEPNMMHDGNGRPRLMQRLYWRIYLALLASLTVAAVLFGLAHLRYGEAPAVMLGFRGHLAMLALLLAIAVVVAVAASPWFAGSPVGSSGFRQASMPGGRATYRAGWPSRGATRLRSWQ